ncbi:nucleotide sugar dehydrogenase [Spongorhabdus nitratireducens]
MNKRPCIAVIGLGYVGYPLALGFGQHFETIGFDIDESRIAELSQQYDRTRETDRQIIEKAKLLGLSSDEKHIAKANIYIVTTSTPVTDKNKPDLTEVLNAARTVGRSVSAGDTVILESTVYPGVTEDIFAKEIEVISGLSAGADFFLGYSPERINPGDPFHKLQDIVKVVSATDQSTLDLMYSIYSRIVPEGIHKAESIETAELSKLVENTQRDINIAFINEMYQLALSLGLDFSKVLECARTKWNFIDFTPGLVGGHCVAVDPYYLIHTQEIRNTPSEITRSARQTNEQMVDFVASSFVKHLTRKGMPLTRSRVLILGASFKPNCPDTRNSKALRVIDELMSFGLKPEVLEPVADLSFYNGITWHKRLPAEEYDGILMLTPHTLMIESLRECSHSLLKPGGIFYSLDSTHEALFS